MDILTSVSPSTQHYQWLPCAFKNKPKRVDVASRLVLVWWMVAEQWKALKKMESISVDMRPQSFDTHSLLTIELRYLHATMLSTEMY